MTTLPKGGAPATRDIFSSVAANKFPPIYVNNELVFKEVLAFLDFSRRDLSKILAIGEASVRYDARMTDKTKDFLLQCSVAIDHVAECFNNDPIKVRTWFFVPNPNFGMISAIGLIKLGKIDKLIQFILNAKSSGEAG